MEGALERKAMFAKEVLMKLESAKKQKEWNALSEQTMVLIEEQKLLQDEIGSKKEELDQVCLKLESIFEELSKMSDSLVEVKAELSTKKKMVKYYEKQLDCDTKLNSPTSDDDLTLLCYSVEKAFSVLKGKHCTTKAKLLIEALMTGRILQGQGAAVIHEVTKKYIKNLFCPWKLVKARDVSAVGGFKTTTINALRSVIDEKVRVFSLQPRMSVGQEDCWTSMVKKL
jgi:seryl-tRNA synthetase